MMRDFFFLLVTLVVCGVYAIAGCTILILWFLGSWVLDEFRTLAAFIRYHLTNRRS